MSLIDRVLSGPAFIHKPPVMVDIGGAGGTDGLWRSISQYCHCLTFDPDARDFQVDSGEGARWRKLTVIRSAVTAGDSSQIPFFLTRSPHCSSSLRPVPESLRNWHFGPQFDVVRRIDMPAVTLGHALQEAGVDYIDWYKSDSQGTDLRLWSSLPTALRETVSVVSLEPGIIDAYEGEDKLADVLAAFDTSEWYLAKLELRGARRLEQDQLRGLSGLHRRLAEASLPVAPGWGEAWFLKVAQESMRWQAREYLMLWVASTILKQYGHAWTAARLGLLRTNDPQLAECQRESQRRLARLTPYLGVRLMQSARARLSQIPGRLVRANRGRQPSGPVTDRRAP
jgi:hypothetical protein